MILPWNAMPFPMTMNADLCIFGPTDSGFKEYTLLWKRGSWDSKALRMVVPDRGDIMVRSVARRDGVWYGDAECVTLLPCIGTSLGLGLHTASKGSTSKGSTIASKGMA